MINWDRQYRMIAMKDNTKLFEIGQVKPGEFPMPLRIAFSIERAESEEPNTGKLSIWNLSATHIANLKTSGCKVYLYAGYGDSRALVFSGDVSDVTTESDGADVKTSAEVSDGLAAIRDTYVCVSYTGAISAKTILDDMANQMGVPVSYSYNADFYTLPNGYSYVGKAANALTYICGTSKLTWSIQNGIMQVKVPGDVMTPEVFILKAQTGMIGSPKEFSESASSEGAKDLKGWEVQFLMNAAININDKVYLDSREVKGFFRVHSIGIDGDTHGDSWSCTAKLIA